MIDENYHIEDIDDFFIQSNHHKEDAPKIIIDNDEDSSKKSEIRTKVIYESSSTLDEEDSYREESYRYRNRDDEHDEPSSNEQVCIQDVSNKKISSLESWISKSYRKRPNTFMGTIIGVIISILILLIGFWKTFLIFVVVLIANIIGQYLDHNQRLISLIEMLIRRLRF